MTDILNRWKRRWQNAGKSTEPAAYAEVERAEQIFYLKYLREEMTVFDVGANVGELTLLFSRFTGTGGSVHAFEPSRAAFKRLAAICRAANRHNIVLNNLALSDKNDTIRLHVYADDYLSFNSQAARPLKDYGLDVDPIGIEEIPATTIDDYCAEKKIERIDLLKIDTEGAELQVMKGARKMLESGRVKCVVFEFGQTTFDMGNRPADIEDFLAEMNYEIRNVVDGDPVFPGRESVATARFSMHVATPREA